MPMFEFVCEQCSSQFELLVHPGEKPDCPKCGSVKIEKLMSVSAGRVAGGSALPIASPGPAPAAHSCFPGCCHH